MQLEIASQLVQEMNLPWQLPLAQWPRDRFVDQERCPGEAYRLKCSEAHLLIQEVSSGHGLKIFQLLQSLENYDLPAAKPMALVQDRDVPGDLLLLALPQEAVSLSEFLITNGTDAATKPLANLLVHLHLAGLTGNTHENWKFAIHSHNGEFHAILLSGFGDLVHHLPDEQRSKDINALHGPLNSASGDALLSDCETRDFIASVNKAYAVMWDAVANTRLFSDDSNIHLAVRVNKVESELAKQVPPGSIGLSLRCSVVENKNHHKMLLHLLTGLDAREDRGKHVLRDIYRYHAWLEFSSGRKWPRALAANRWMAQVMMPAIAALPGELNKTFATSRC